MACSCGGGRMVCNCGGGWMKRHLNLILMAAGNSERYGANKLLADIDGKPMYRHLFDHLVRYQDEHKASCLVTVVSQYDEILDAAVTAGFTAVRNTRPQDGISRTIQLGLEAGQESRTGAVFFTADQPYIRYETIAAFIQVAESNRTGILAAAHHGVSGNPVFFDQSYFCELQQLTGDQGGKRVMNRHLDDVTLFDMQEQELIDIDQPTGIIE